MMAFIINAFAPDSIITSITRHIHWAMSSGFLCEIFRLKNLLDFWISSLAQYSFAKLSQSWAKLSRVEPSWVRWVDPKYLLKWQLRSMCGTLDTFLCVGLTNSIGTWPEYWFVLATVLCKLSNFDNHNTEKKTNDMIM